ncbi:hypothetical protein GSI_01378 [Ganoderma sinense ZZ0214-1]|uniref:Uncharacterized protein n=1 Tax=Ganoderma sinense ZZ0214-1 TaxID=1077348 RepID=A0A2G8SV94_9APHY|nr:hypothetical protein GSI_01378 [Ganoderma sinense ZZ0214-1]
MFIYNGKLNCQHASNETITVVFPAGFELNDPVSAYWQWSTDPNLGNKASVENSSFIRTVTKTSNGGVRRIHFSFDSSSFYAIVNPDFQTLSLTMLDSTGFAGSTFDLAASHLNGATVHSAVVYTGSLQWFQHAKEEMMTLVVPYSVSEGAFFGLYYQWTQGPPPNGSPKQNVAIKGKFQQVSPVSSDGQITATFEEGGFKYQFTFSSDKGGSLLLSHTRQLLMGIPEVRFAVAYKPQ